MTRDKIQGGREADTKQKDSEKKTRKKLSKEELIPATSCSILGKKEIMAN